MGYSLEGLAVEDLRVMLAAMEEGSLNRAAKSLSIRQSTASRRLMRLEEHLGLHLFDRVPEGLMPTHYADALRPHVEAIEAQLQDILKLAEQRESKPAGTVRLALPDGLASQWLMPNVSDLFLRYPDIDLELLIGHSLVDLLRREADIALRFVRPNSGDLIAKRLANLSLGTYVSPSLKHVPHQKLRWAAFIDPDETYIETRWLQEFIRPEKVIRCSSWNTMYAAVKEGVAAAVLSDEVGEKSGFHRINTEFPPPESRELYVVYHRALRNVPSISAVRDWLLEEAQRFSQPLIKTSGQRRNELS